MPPATGINAAQLKAIQDERIKLLTQVVEILTSQYKVATVDYPQVASAESDLCNALLDSTDEPEKRVALLTKQLDKANEVVKLMQGRFDAGTVSEVDVDRAKVLCLDIKTKLLRERSKERPMTITPTTKRP
ncbi:MAG: TolC family protein [Thermoguttaceae bacterium]|jgi:outer membrane protein TolC